MRIIWRAQPHHRNPKPYIERSLVAYSCDRHISDCRLFPLDNTLTRTLGGCVAFDDSIRSLFGGWRHFPRALTNRFCFSSHTKGRAVVPITSRFSRSTSSTPFEPARRPSQKKNKWRLHVLSLPVSTESAPTRKGWCWRLNLEVVTSCQKLPLNMEKRASISSISLAIFESTHSDPDSVTRHQNRKHRIRTRNEINTNTHVPLETSQWNQRQPNRALIDARSYSSEISGLVDSWKHEAMKLCESS